MGEQKGTALNDFSQGKVSSVILRMAVPATIAQLVNVLYNIVDRMYVGNIPDYGESALTGLGVALPIIMLVTAFSNLCSFGGAPLCSIARGRGDVGEARDIMCCSFTLLLISGALLTAVFLVWLEPFLLLFGASEVTLPYAKDYTFIYLLGTEFVMISLGMNSFINSQGFASVGMRTVIIGAGLNIVLDPIFIYDWGLGLGVRGAALATVVSQLVSAVWVLRFLTGKRALFTLSVSRMFRTWRHTGPILKLGASGFVFGVTNSLVQAVTNKTLLLTGGNVYVCIMTIACSVREFAMVVHRGMSQGAEPVESYNYGAGKYGRVMEAVRFLTLAALAAGALTTALIEIFPGAILSVFNAAPETLEKGVPALRVFFSMQFMIAFQFGGQSTFVSTNHPGKAVFFSLLRKVLVVVPLVLLLPRLWGLGALGVFLAEPISDVVGGLICFAAMRLTVWRELKAGPGTENVTGENTPAI